MSTEPQKEASTQATVGSPWPKGVSGNPSGKSKTKMLTDALKACAAQNPVRVRNIAEQIFVLAEKGSLEHAKFIWDRIEGKPVQQMELAATVEHLSPQDRTAKIIELQAKVIPDAEEDAPLLQIEADEA